MNIVNPITLFWIRVGAYVFYRARVRGRENMRKAGTFILAGNHVSNLDPPIVAAFASPRDVHFMAKEELFSKPILSWLLPRLLAFPVNRERSARAPLSAALKRLRTGTCVGIFPEGRRNAGERDVRLGMAWLAIAAGVPVVPCAISGSRGAKLFRTQIKVRYGPPIYPPRSAATNKEALNEFTDEIMRAIAALNEENERRAD